MTKVKTIFNCLTLAMVGLVAWSAIEFATSARSAGQPTDPRSIAAGSSLTPTLPLVGPGVWTLGDVQWRISTKAIAQGELESALRQPPHAMLTACPPSRDLDRIFARLKPSMDSESQGGFELYGIDAQSTMLRFLTQVAEDGQEHVATARIAYPRDEDRWTLVTIENAKHESDSGAAPSLLPPTRSHRRVAARVDQQRRRLHCEVFTVAESTDALRSHWEEHGWDISQRTDQGTTSFRCRRGGTVVKVTTTNASPNGSLTTWIAMDVTGVHEVANAAR